jgi:hypothetical protein
MRELILLPVVLLLGLAACTVVEPNPQPTATVVTPVPQTTYVAPAPMTTVVPTY